MVEHDIMPADLPLDKELKNRRRSGSVERDINSSKANEERLKGARANKKRSQVAEKKTQS